VSTGTPTGTGTGTPTGTGSGTSTGTSTGTETGTGTGTGPAATGAVSGVRSPVAATGAASLGHSPGVPTPARRLPWPTRWVIGVVIAVLAIGIPFWVDGYWRSTFAFVAIAAIGALGLDVLTGWTGQISLGHAFFLAVGAYVGGYIGTHFGVTAALWIPAGAAAAGVIGGIAGPAALRLRGLYLAIVTIGLVYIGYYALETWTAFSGGPGGEALPAVTFGSWNFANGVTVAGHTFTRDQCYYYLALLLLAAGMLYVRNVTRSNLGRSMVAVRDRELAAAVLGVNVARTKIRAFVISSVLAGVAGALYGSFLSFSVPPDWGLLLSIEYVVMIVVGGMASLWGPVLGALFVVGLPALLQNVSTTLTFLSNTNSNTGLSPADAAEIVYGVFLVAFLLLEPGGLVGLARRISRAVLRAAGRSATGGGRTAGAVPGGG
jgi:branched-chain amino acid transport system permease protein